MASKKGCTTSQLALAWVLSKGDFIFPIPGTKRLKYLEENIKSTLISFSKDELDALDIIAPKGVASGMRYPEAMMKLVGA
jgi:aryl-alcohol dehydrogenase-like predicted oxidoreductase